jgi:hypothetical protein
MEPMIPTYEIGARFRKDGHQAHCREGELEVRIQRIGDEPDGRVAYVMVSFDIVRS